MLGGLLREKSLAWWGMMSVSDIAEDLGGGSIGGMVDDADAEFVGGAFEAESKHGEGSGSSVCGKSNSGDSGKWVGWKYQGSEVLRIEVYDGALIGVGQDVSKYEWSDVCKCKS